MVLTKMATEENTDQKAREIWEKECNGKCIVLENRTCQRYEKGGCKFPETKTARRIIYFFQHRDLVWRLERE